MTTLNIGIPLDGSALATSPLTVPGYVTIGGTYAVITPVPEPSTWAMLLLGFGFVGGAMRTAKRRQRIAVSYA